MTAKELLTILQQEKYDVKNLPVGYFKDDQHFIRLIGTGCGTTPPETVPRRAGRSRRGGSRRRPGGSRRGR